MYPTIDEMYVVSAKSEQVALELCELNKLPFNRVMFLTGDRDKRKDFILCFRGLFKRSQLIGCFTLNEIMDLVREGEEL